MVDSKDGVDYYLKNDGVITVDQDRMIKLDDVEHNYVWKVANVANPKQRLMMIFNTEVKTDSFKTIRISKHRANGSFGMELKLRHNIEATLKDDVRKTFVNDAEKFGIKIEDDDHEIEEKNEDEKIIFEEMELQMQVNHV